MEKCKSYLFLIVVFYCNLFFIDNVQARASLDKAAVSKKFAAEIKRYKISPEHLAIYIGPTGEQGELAAINADKLMIPASITKLATAAAFINTQLPGAKIKTSLFTSGTIKDGVLKGDLYLKGGGDPSFVSENMWFLVNAFLRSGIKKIEGHIVVDDSLFDSSRFDQSRQAERVDRAYDAPTGAMSFNWNSVNVFVRPGKKAGDAGQVFADPENEYIRVINKVKTVADGKTSIEVDRDPDKGGVGDLLVVTGKIAVDSPEVVLFKNITKPDYWSGYNLKAFLKQRDIQVAGQVKTGVVPTEAILVAESESKGMDQILADMNKFSNNYVAEMLTKLMALQSEKVGTIAGGMKHIQSYMQSLNIKESDYFLQNPSGLTRNNKITAKAMWRVLDAIKDDFKTSVEYMTSLPISGVDGTLKKRMKDSKAERWVRAKTGLLTGVISLAGYIGNSNGDVQPFVFIFNGTEDGAKVRQLFDSLCEILVE